MRFVVVTGTSTGVGKTVTTAALARVALDRGCATAMVKPVQTGTATGELGDADVVRRLSGCESVSELVTLGDPLAPDSAARLRGVAIPGVAELAESVVALAADRDLVVVEGSGGVLVRLDAAGGTLLDLCRLLARDDRSVGLVVVTTLALGTLNHTELTVAAARAAGVDVAGLVLGSVGEAHDLAARTNLADLPRVTGLPILGAIPAGVGDWEPASFRAACAGWLPPAGWLEPPDGAAQR